MSALFAYIDLHATNSPEKPAIILADRFITYRMLADGIQSVANAIIERGLDRNAPVALTIESPSWHIIASLALLKLGYASFSLPSAIKHETLGFEVKDIIATSLASTGSARMHVMSGNWFGNPKGKTRFEFAPNRIARIAFTSGSTGRMKPIGKTQDAYLGRGAERYMIWGLTRQRVLCLMGLNTSASFALVIRTLLSGATLCFAPSLEEQLRLIGYLGVTMLFGSTRQVTALAELGRTTPAQTNTLQQIYMGGGLATHSIISQIRETFPAEIFDVYGSTEASLCAIASGPLLTQRASGVVRLAPFTDIKIEPIDGADPVGRIGVRSECLGRLFEGRLDLTEAEVQPDYFFSGDTGYLDADGCLVLAGRADEVINQGGLKMDPEMIEAVLIKHPDIRDVAIVGQIDMSGVGHEAWCAYEADKDLSLEEVTTWLRNHKKQVTLHRLARVESVPRDGNMGKVSRQLVREIFTKRDGGA